jgi:inorganic pyrophosphatase
MPKNGNRASALANPLRLRPKNNDDPELVQVVIETPKNSRNKYAFDPEQKVFQLKKVLPEGMVFPYDFGFVPRTKADDGDPVDVLVLMDEPAFPGCVLKCRLIGIIEGEQMTGNGKERNDRLVAIEKDNHSFADIEHLDDMGKLFLEGLERFFENYHALKGDKYRVLGAHGPGRARKCIEKGMQAARGR